MPGTTVSTGTDARGGIPAGYPTDVDALSPLVITALAPNPIPVTGTDGKVHVVYELEVLNYSPRVATVTRLETLAGGPDGKVVATLDAEALAERTNVVMDSELKPNPVIPVGRTGVILVDDGYDSVSVVPGSVTHRLSATFAPITAENAGGISRLWPSGESVSQIGGPVTTSAQSPVVIGPPLAGPGWLASNGCCGFSTHRAMLPYAGRINGGERFAIDWSKVDLTINPLTEASFLKPGGVATRNEDYLSYGEPLLAVADGSIVTAISDAPDNTAVGVQPTDIGFADLGGNVVTIDIGNGVYATYNHLAPGSPTKVGNKVTRGQIIGHLGNAGSSFGPHLHFQLQRSVGSHMGDNVPFEINTLTYLGSVGDTDRFTSGPNAGARTNQLPLKRSVVDFPAAP